MLKNRLKAIAGQQSTTGFLSQKHIHSHVRSTQTTFTYQTHWLTYVRDGHTLSVPPYTRMPACLNTHSCCRLRGRVTLWMRPLTWPGCWSVHAADHVIIFTMMTSLYFTSQCRPNAWIHVSVFYITVWYKHLKTTHLGVLHHGEIHAYKNNTSLCSTSQCNPNT